MNKPKILIITDGRPIKHSLIDWMRSCWLDNGYAVELISSLDKDVEADIAFLYIDQTNVPQKYLDYASRYPFRINSSLCSIDKTLFSTQRLHPGSDYSGKVIVKTIANYGGIPELDAEPISKLKKKLFHKLKKLITSNKIKNSFLLALMWKHVRVLDPGNYPVFSSSGDLPKTIWKNPFLLVEKFLPEQLADGRYMLRHWYFLGDKEFSRTLIANNPIPKWKSMNDAEKSESRNEWFNINVDQQLDIPEKVRQVREQLNMDFGRIDWALCDGEAVIFDANKTPSGLGGISLDNELDHRRYDVMKQFSRGIEIYTSLKI